MSGYANWNPATTYSTNDIVDYDARIWVSLTNANLNHIPTTSPTWWSQIGGGGVISSIVAGNGITVSGGGSSRVVATNLASADARLTITSGVGTQLVLTNTCPAAVAAGTGLSLAGTNPTGLTLSMPNVGTAATSAYPSSITTDAQGRVSAVVAGSAPVASVSAGTNITITGTATNPIINASSGSAGAKAFLNEFSPASNLWGLISNISFPISGAMPSAFIMTGIIFSSGGTPYQGGNYPPGFVNIQFSCPVSTSSTPFSPGTNWNLGSLTAIKCQLLNKDYSGTNPDIILDEGTCFGFTQWDTTANIQYFNFQIQLQIPTSTPAGSGAGNDYNLALAFSLANGNFSGNYSYNASGTVGVYEYIKASITFTS